MWYGKNKLNKHTKIICMFRWVSNSERIKLFFVLYAQKSFTNIPLQRSKNDFTLKDPPPKFLPIKWHVRIYNLLKSCQLSFVLKTILDILFAFSFWWFKPKTNVMMSNLFQDFFPGFLVPFQGVHNINEWHVHQLSTFFPTTRIICNILCCVVTTYIILTLLLDQA